MFIKEYISYKILTEHYLNLPHQLRLSSALDTAKPMKYNKREIDIYTKLFYFIYLLSEALSLETVFFMN